MKEFYRAYKIEPERIYKLQQQENKKKFTYVNSKISHNQGKPQLKRLITEVEVCKWKVKKVQIYYPEITAEKILKLEELLNQTFEIFEITSNYKKHWFYIVKHKNLTTMLFEMLADKITYEINIDSIHENRPIALINLLIKVKDYIDNSKVKEIVEGGN